MMKYSFITYIFTAASLILVHCATNPMEATFREADKASREVNEFMDFYAQYSPAIKRLKEVARRAESSGPSVDLNELGDDELRMMIRDIIAGPAIIGFADRTKIAGREAILKQALCPQIYAKIFLALIPPSDSLRQICYGNANIEIENVVRKLSEEEPAVRTLLSKIDVDAVE